MEKQDLHIRLHSLTGPVPASSKEYSRKRVRRGEGDLHISEIGGSELRPEETGNEGWFVV